MLRTYMLKLEKRRKRISELGKKPKQKKTLDRVRRESPLEAALALQFFALQLVPVREFRFHPDRRWRFDFAFPDKRIAVEVEGGIYGNGRHQRIGGFTADCEKYNEAAILGWRVLRVTASHIQSGQAIEWVKAVVR